MSLVERTARDVAALHAINEMRIPLLERIDLFARSSGDTTDLVEKQMYVVQRPSESAGEETMVLRPEGTPGVVRAYLDLGFGNSQEGQNYQRFFYSGPMLRYERPQKGRYREFWQFGVEIFGRTDPLVDAELILMIDELRVALNQRVKETKAFHIKPEFEIRLVTQLNSLGCADCRPAFRERLIEFGRSNFERLCVDCKRRLTRNPLRMLDCKIDASWIRSSDAPRSIDFLCQDCKLHHDSVKLFLDNAGVQYEENPWLVRGLDYYTRTVFEVVSNSVGSQNAVAAGGRYDGLVEALGGAAIPGVGFAVGVDRLVLAITDAINDYQQDRALQPEAPISQSKSWLGKLVRAIPPHAAIIGMGSAALLDSFLLAYELRAIGLRVDVMWGIKLRSSLRDAIGTEARFIIIIGQNEVDQKVVQLREMNNSILGEPEPVERSEIVQKLADKTSSE